MLSSDLEQTINECTPLTTRLVQLSQQNSPGNYSMAWENWFRCTKNLKIVETVGNDRVFAFVDVHGSLSGKAKQLNVIAVYIFIDHIEIVYVIGMNSGDTRSPQLYVLAYVFMGNSIQWRQTRTWHKQKQSYVSSDVWQIFPKRIGKHTAFKNGSILQLPMRKYQRQ